MCTNYVGKYFSTLIQTKSQTDVSKLTNVGRLLLFYNRYLFGLHRARKAPINDRGKSWRHHIVYVPKSTSTMPIQCDERIINMTSTY